MLVMIPSVISSAFLELSRASTVRYASPASYRARRQRELCDSWAQVIPGKRRQWRGAGAKRYIGSPPSPAANALALQTFPDEAVLPEPGLDFSHSVRPEPHRDRTKQILRDHPGIRALIGPAPFTFWCILALVGLQFGVAWFVADRPMWLVFSRWPTPSALSPATGCSS